jgi:signal transduction histidine kinase
VTVQLDLPSDATLRALPGEVAVNLYRVAQEALSNVARHAAARLVSVRLVWQASRLVLTLHDDGRGFVVPAHFHDLTAQGHFGLVGMGERVNLIGGDWTVESTPGQGTTVRVAWQPQP